MIKAILPMYLTIIIIVILIVIIIVIVIIILIIIYFFQVETVCFWIKSKITIKIMKKFRATHYLVNEL